MATHTSTTVRFAASFNKKQHNPKKNPAPKTLSPATLRIHPLLNPPIHPHPLHARLTRVKRYLPIHPHPRHPPHARAQLNLPKNFGVNSNLEFLTSPATAPAPLNRKRRRQNLHSLVQLKEHRIPIRRKPPLHLLAQINHPTIHRQPISQVYIQPWGHL